MADENEVKALIARFWDVRQKLTADTPETKFWAIVASEALRWRDETRPPPPAAAVPEPILPVPDSMGLSREQREVEDAFRRGWNSCRARVMQLNAYALAVRNKENNNE